MKAKADEQPEFHRDEVVATGRSARLGVNLADAVASIQGQIDQLEAEIRASEFTDEKLVSRVKSIRNALAQIAPEV